MILLVEPKHFRIRNTILLLGERCRWSGLVRGMGRPRLKTTRANVPTACGGQRKLLKGKVDNFFD